ncbi:sensor histidine kinase [Malaciobacter mytili]|uniref:sensor histidine kinase n=1 Tax=Malaciobacter mytili TaxID=603050 RepID=UPI003A882677
MLFISVIFNINKGLKATLIYVLGWSFVCLFLYIMQIKSLYIQSGYIDLVLIAFAIEAVLFTLSLANKYKELKLQNLNYENMLLHQNRLAKSGSMIVNIAHQWRQPLNSLSYILINLKSKYESDNLTKEYFYKKFNQANEQLQFMSKTIDDFKDFYTPSKKKEEFYIKDSIQKAFTILNADIKQKRVNVSFDFHANEFLKVYGISNELSQVILTLIKNSIDAVKNENEPFIRVDVSSDSTWIKIEIEDNGRGVKAKDIPNLFKAYYTTKKEGFGIGLYLVKTIIEDSFMGKVEVKALKKGIKFIIFLEKSF